MLFLLLWKHSFLLYFFFATCLFHPLEYFAAWFFAKKEKIVDLSANENSSNSFPAQGFPPFSSRAGVSYWRRLEGIVAACCSGAFPGRPRKHWNALWLHGTQGKKAPWPFPGPFLRISPALLLHLYAYPIDLIFCYSQAASFKIEHGGYTEKTLVERLLFRKLILVHFGLALLSHKHVHTPRRNHYFLACLNIRETTIFMTWLFKLKFSFVKAHGKKLFNS